uniref:SGNH hydrolase-type esterase domain-containing protein n=1 Tax=Tanacetum cinerariifolium TaxID=118510 RepID=A0A6L2KT62_TANCI|nr:SGNH hydrolase-type esterase domain-containing protein [Tanacetum cinerariifolium]
MEYDPSNVDFAEWLALKFSNHMMMDWYTKNTLWIYWIGGDDEEVLTKDEQSDLEEESLSEGNEIDEIFRIETDIFYFKTLLCKAFKEFNYLLNIDVDGIKDEKESSDNAWSHYSPIDEWKDYEHTIYIKIDVNSNQNTYNYVCQIFMDHAGTTNDDDAVHADQGWFDNHEAMKNNDDDMVDLGEYLIPNEGPYYVNE